MNNQTTLARTLSKLLDEAYAEVQTLAKANNWDEDKIMDEEDTRFAPIYAEAEKAGIDFELLAPQF